MTETIEGAHLAVGAVRTFLIADVRGYTRFTVEHGDEAAAKLAGQFAAITREIVSAHEGQVIELRGDEALAVFSSARQALRAAIVLQQRYAPETMAGMTMPLKVGIGLDAGEAIPVEGGYRGAALNLAARLCSLAGPGEVLASEGVVHLARKLEGLTYLERGAVQLKGFADPVRVVQVIAEVADEPAPSADAAERVRAHPLPIGGFLGALPAGPLVAREAELGKVLSIIDAVSGGSGRLVFLVGEPGIGKTRLGQEIALQLRNRSFVVASGRCYEPQEAVPFYPFLEALGTLSTTAPSSSRTDIARRWPYLLGLLPTVHQPAPASSAEGKEDQERLFWSVTGFVQAIAEEGPVALLLDDLHWADSTSLALLQHLARHTRAYPVLLLGTYRDVEVGRRHPLGRALRDLHREQLAERVGIRRLEQGGTQALIAATLGEAEVPDELTELLQRYTEGNPFFVQEALRALVERGDVYRHNGGWGRRVVEEIEVPESVRDAIGERLSRLSDPAQELLHAASVLGQTFAFDDLQELGGQSESDLEDALEEAVARGLLQELGRDSYSFNHALTHQVLYAELPLRRKRRLHRAAGEALEHRLERNRQGRQAELAWHFLQGGDPERALLYAMLAGDQARETFAHVEAEHHYRTALSLASELNDQTSEMAALEKLGNVLGIQGRYDESLQALERAAAMHHMVADHDGECRIVTTIGEVHAGRGTPDEGIARIQPLLDRMEAEGPSVGLTTLYMPLVWLFWQSGQGRRGLEAAERAADLARALHDDRMLVRAEYFRGGALYELGYEAEARRVLDEVVGQAEAMGDVDTLFWAAQNLAECCVFGGEVEQARATCERALELGERTGSPDYLVAAMGVLGWLSFVLGDWEQARVSYERAAKLLASFTSSFLSSDIACSRAELCLAEGAWEEASQHFEAFFTSERTAPVPYRLATQRLLAERDLLEGHPEQALARLEPLFYQPGFEGQQVALLLPVLAEAHLRTGDTVQAENIVVKRIEQMSRQGHQLALVSLLRVHGMVLAQRDCREEADRSFADAVSAARSIPFPYAEARALYEWGLLFVRMGATKKAQERLTEALAIFRRLGARPYVERTEQALAELE